MDKDFLYKEMTKRFKVRTEAHIERVWKWSCKIRNNGFPMSVDISKHDSSKFEEPEHTPYLHIGWKSYMRRLGQDYEIEPEIQEQMHQATFHHITTNSHHPEYWDPNISIDMLNQVDRHKPAEKPVNAVGMPNENIAEMLADWMAVAEELGTSPIEWAAN